MVSRGRLGFIVLSTTSEYALRALLLLAQTPPEQTVLGRELAVGARIPPRYLSKIMLALRRAGLVSASRGTGGGYTLLRPAAGIHLVEVVELFEGAGARPQCFLGVNTECNEEQPCSAHAYWKGVRKSYVDFLESTTLKDISLTPGRVRRIGRWVGKKK